MFGLNSFVPKGRRMKNQQSRQIKTEAKGGHPYKPCEFANDGEGEHEVCEAAVRQRDEKHERHGSRGETLHPFWA